MAKFNNFLARFNISTRFSISTINYQSFDAFTRTTKKPSMYNTSRQNKTTVTLSSDGEIQHAAKINKLEFDFESFAPFLYGA